MVEITETVKFSNESWRELRAAMAQNHAAEFLKMQHVSKFRTAFEAGDEAEMRRLIETAPEIQRNADRSLTGTSPKFRTPKITVEAAERDGRKLSVDEETGAIVVRGGAITDEAVVLALEYHAKAVVAFLRERNAPLVVVPARLCR